MKRFTSLIFFAIVTISCLKAQQEMLAANCSKISLTIENKLDDAIKNLIVNGIEVGDLSKSNTTTVCLESAMSYNRDIINHLSLEGSYMGVKINPMRFFCGTGLLTIEEGEYKISITDTFDQRFVYK